MATDSIDLLREADAAAADARVRRLQAVSASAERLGADLGRLNNPAVPPAAKPDDMGLTDGQAAFARGLKLPGAEGGGGTSPSPGNMGLTDAQAAYARGLKFPA